MSITAFYARKGGVGKSTHAFNFACYVVARTSGKVLLVSTDPQGDSVRWSGEADRRLRIDDMFESSFGYSALFAPERVVDADFAREWGFDLVIVDMPPAAEAIANVYPDVWVSPIDGRNALMDTMPAIKAMQEQGGQILWLPNRIDAAGSVSKKLILGGLDQVRNSVVLPTILDSVSVAKVAECSQPVWAVPYGAGTQGARAVQDVCDEILKYLPGLPPLTKRRKRS